MRERITAKKKRRISHYLNDEERNKMKTKRNVREGKEKKNVVCGENAKLEGRAAKENNTR